MGVDAGRKEIAKATRARTAMSAASPATPRRMRRDDLRRVTAGVASRLRSAAGHEKSARAGSGLIGLLTSAASASVAALASASAASAAVNAVAPAAAAPADVSAATPAEVAPAAAFARRAAGFRVVLPVLEPVDRRLVAPAAVGRAAARARDASYRLRSSESLSQSRAVLRRATRERVAEASTLGRCWSICQW
jgi:hypothetical protein